MNPFQCVWTRLFVSLLLFASQALVCSHAALAASNTGVPYPQTRRDGQHDFDFHFGSWKTHIARRTLSPSGTPTSVTLDGTVTVRKIWGGRANLEEAEADGAGGHFEDLGLFVYNPTAHQWGIYFAGSKDGTLGFPAAIGAFKNGRGEFFDQEMRNGRSVIVRLIWSNITPNSHHFEQAFSNDGGRTWETNFTASLTRDRRPPAQITSARVPLRRGVDSDGQHAFDFGLGTWKEHTSRLLRPLTGSQSWIQMDGVSVDKPIWNGRANLVELESDGANRHLELFSLRLYNSQTRQWNLYFATSGVGIVSHAMTGGFKNGRGEFFSQDTVNGRTVLTRFTVAELSATSERSEQAFSDDGGRSWETNWINQYARRAP